jgi:glyoxylase-like metal-dependent hydrolase (beta-lactamase superfamily II)
MNYQTICSTCGTYFPVATVPELCTICNEDRQYIPETGQSWTKPEELHTKHSITINQLKENLYELEITPQFAIGQRALLVISESGNILWDCIPMLDEVTIDFIKSKGGLRAIAFSHPHYYSNMNDWAEVFDCPVYIHENDSPYIIQKSSRITLWQGEEFSLWDGIKIMLVGGHFEGSSILHVPFLSKDGSILCGDTLFLSPNKKHFSVMRSYPNKIPLSLSEIKRIKKRMESISFDTFYGYVKVQNLDTDVKQIFSESMDKYLA